ncbi:MAG: tRNA (adenine-N(1))-methyltransferase [Bacillaceae bacterium]|nr:tRNA (adenine-N(1))-methyltransferase [Bacillaceae bacterium]
MPIAISRRLQTVAQYVPDGFRLADIGTDHAYLPIYLVRSGRIPSAVAGEVHQGPYQAARGQVEKYGLSSRIDVRLGDGLAVLKKGEADAVTIAGMGGALMVRILEDGRTQLENVRCLVLQPNVGEYLVRQWLMEHGWELTAESIIEEDGQIYEILAATPGDGYRPYRKKPYPQEWLLEIGPFLLEESSPILLEKWNQELHKLNRIRDQISRSTDPEALRKKTEVEEKIRMIKEVFTCLPEDKR